MSKFSREDGLYEISDSGYGKSAVKILHLKRFGKRHEIKEFEVSTTLRLSSHKDYEYGDNSHIIATDSQKNTVYLIAKKYGVNAPEHFGMVLCNHFLNTYSQVKEVTVKVEEYPWQRINRNNEDHNHAFVFTPVAKRTSLVNQKRKGMAYIKKYLNIVCI